ncbi:LamG domain-containing protein [Gemmatimonadota bacterium]
MKILICLAVIPLLVFCCKSSQTDINSGLAAYYPFDGNALDIIGGDIPAEVDGAVLTTDRFGNKNSAYSFDGVKANILAEVREMPATQSAQSFSWWYLVNEIQTYADELGAGNMIVLVDPVNGNGIQFGFRAPGYHTLGFDTWNWGGGTLLEVEPPPTNVWHHCVYTFDGSTHRFYLNGKETASSNAETPKGTPTQLMFGNYPSGDQFFKGKLDDVRIYNRVLTQAEINYLYTRN